jgi:hypothetical protein
VDCGLLDCDAVFEVEGGDDTFLRNVDKHVQGYKSHNPKNHSNITYSHFHRHENLKSHRDSRVYDRQATRQLQY